MKIPAFIANAAKAWVAGTTTALAAALPQIQEATNTLVTAVIVGVFGFAATWLVKNRPAGT